LSPSSTVAMTTTDRPPLLSASSLPAGGNGGHSLSTDTSPYHRSRVQSPGLMLQSRQSFGTAGATSLAGSLASAPGVQSGTGRGSAATLSDSMTTTTTTHDVGDMKAAALAAAAAAAASASLTTADSDDVGGSASDGNQLGRIQFSLVYNFQACDATILACSVLPTISFVRQLTCYRRIYRRSRDLVESVEGDRSRKQTNAIAMHQIALCVHHATLNVGQLKLNLAFVADLRPS